MNSLKEIALKDISLSKLNSRRHFNEQKMQELANSIKEKGIIEPVIVRLVNGKHEIVCGERRFKASQKAGLKNIPAIIRELTDVQVLELQIIENLQRDDLNPIEEAQGFKALLDKCKYTQEALAKKIGKSQGFIAARMALLNIRDDYQKDIISGILSPGHLKYLMVLTGCDRILDGIRIEMKPYEQISVKEFKAAVERVIERRARSLAMAEFNTKNCKNCSFRRTVTRYGYKTIKCFRPECFSKKQRAALKAKKERLKDNVKKGKVIDKSMMKHVESLEQAGILFDKKICKGCVKKKIGYRAGWNGKKVRIEVCTDKECFKKKQEAAKTAQEKKKTEEFKKRVEFIKRKAMRAKGHRSFWVAVLADKIYGGYYSDKENALIMAYKLDKNKIKTRKAAIDYFTSNKKLDLEEMFRFITYWDD